MKYYKPNIMKYILPLLLILTLAGACKKEDTTQAKNNSLAEDLKQVIQQEGVQALAHCCLNCSCSQTIGFGTDYSFPGDNFVRIGTITYNLNKLEYYRIDTYGSGNQKEKRMTLYFP